MSRYDFRKPRLFVDHPLHQGATIALDRDQANYLGNVLRLGSGDGVLIFNGRDGEWAATIAADRRVQSLSATDLTRPQPPAADLRYAFAPLKHARLDYMVQKAVEMGATALCPVITRHTQVSRVNAERMRANAIEAAEQCGILTLADVAEPVPLAAFLAEPREGRLLVFCDEEAKEADPIAALRAAGRPAGIDLLIGPEGVFSEDEREALIRQKGTVRLSLGPRILRADTAAVAALALIQAAFGSAAPEKDVK
jgi:16S rRNA (uracil1498-N3)-methyltransferase